MVVVTVLFGHVISLPQLTFDGKTNVKNDNIKVEDVNPRLGLVASVLGKILRKEIFCIILWVFGILHTNTQ